MKAILTPFSLPAVITADSKAFAPSSKKLKAWVKAYQQASSGKSPRLLYAALAEVNRTDIPLKRRLDIQRQLLPLCEELLPNLQRRLVGLQAPLSNRQRRTLMLYLGILQEQVVQEKQIISAKIAASKKLPGRDQLAAHITQAMETLAQLITTALDYYAAFSPTLWRDLHQLYQLAHHLELDEHKLRLGKLPAHPLQQLYCALVLLGSALPYSLKRGECARLRNGWHEWLKHIQLVSPEAAASGASLWINPQLPQPSLRLPTPPSPAHQWIALQSAEFEPSTPSQGAIPKPLRTRLLRDQHFPCPNMAQTGEAVEFAFGIAGALHILAPKRMAQPGEDQKPQSLQLEAQSGQGHPGMQSDAWRVPLVDTKAQAKLSQFLDRKEKPTAPPVTVSGQLLEELCGSPGIYTNNPTLPPMEMNALCLARGLGEEPQELSLVLTRGLYTTAQGDTWIATHPLASRVIRGELSRTEGGNRKPMAVLVLDLEDATRDMSGRLAMAAEHYRTHLKGRLKRAGKTHTIVLGEAIHQGEGFVVCGYGQPDF